MSKQPSRAVNLEQSTGRYFRLKQELAIAYGAVPWNSGRLDRLTNELAATEREIAALVAMPHVITVSIMFSRGRGRALRPRVI